MISETEFDWKVTNKIGFRVALYRNRIKRSSLSFTKAPPTYIECKIRLLPSCPQPTSINKAGHVTDNRRTSNESSPTTNEPTGGAFSGSSPLLQKLPGTYIKGAIERWLKHQKRGLPELMIEARTLSGQVPLIDHNDIVEMLHGPIYIGTERESPWY